MLDQTPQDVSRLCLSEAVLHARLSSDACFVHSFDKSTYAGHLYSDKAPGVAALALLPVAVLRPGPPSEWPAHKYRLWGVRVLTIGAAFLVCAFMLGRVAEGLAPGYGGISLVTFALGTLVAPLAAVSFEQVPAAMFGFAVFLLAWRRRAGLAGLVGGGALLVEYETGLILVLVGGYLAFAGWRLLRGYVTGLVPGAVLLGAYNWAAFGAPWHLSYRYLANSFAAEQSTGLFGIGRPHLFGLTEVFAGTRGLLVLSPVLVAAGFGLVRLGRTHRSEAIVAGSVAAVFVLSNCGYFDPYGGSPGPRFLAAGLPFIALGLGPAFAWAPRVSIGGGRLVRHPDSRS